MRLVNPRKRKENEKILLFLHFFASLLVSSSSGHQRINRNSYELIKRNFYKKSAWGIETTVDVHNCDPNLIRSEDAIKEYVKQLCDLIQMKRFGETVVVHFGEDETVAGYSMMQLIETSLVSGHFANLTNNIYINIFSCKLYNPYQAAHFTRAFFKGKKCQINISLRV